MMWFLFFILPSCSEDNLSTPDIPDEAESYGYISLIINLADDEATTRSVFDSPVDNTESGLYFFNEGLDQEKAVANNPDAHWVLAYDNNQNIISRLQLEYLQEYSQTGSNKTTAYKGVCKVPLTDPFLSSINNMRVILNASESLQTNLKSGNQNISLIDSNEIFFIDKKGYKYHTMATAMAVINRRLSPTSSLVMENGSLKVYNTISEALEHPSVTLYVERLQSKFTILFANNNKEYYFNNGIVNNTFDSGTSNTLLYTPSDSQTNTLKLVTKYNSKDEDGHDNVEASEYTWKANIVGWGINATEPQEYLFKYLDTSISTIQEWNLYSGTNVIGNYWAVDNNYSKSYRSYPSQYRKANDKIFASNRDQFKSYYENQDTHLLNYYSFFYFSNPSKRNIREYQGENTYSPTQTFSGLADPLGDLTHFRCGSHLIVCAQLLIDRIDNNTTEIDQETGLLSDVSEKFFTNNQYWTREAYIDYFRISMGNNMKNNTKCISDLSEDFVPATQFSPIEDIPKFYVKKDNVYVEASADNFDIVPAEIIGGDGWCFPYPKSEISLYVKTGANTYEIINDDKYKKFVYGNTYYFAKHYNQGCMYYALQIMHNTSRLEEGNFGLRTADHGMVRNNWYHFQIDGVANPGTPVDDLSQPIIPNNEPSPANNIGFEVMIIPWHIVYEEVDI